MPACRIISGVGTKCTALKRGALKRGRISLSEIKLSHQTVGQAFADILRFEFGKGVLGRAPHSLHGVPQNGGK
jgi:hypothetical protein